MAVTIGDRAPDFTLPDQEGTPFALNHVLGRKTIVLYFYPQDETPGCTAEACSFRDNMAEFTASGVQVIGVSQDSVDSHSRFAARHQLNFPLLSDTGNKVRALYGVKPALFGLWPGRKTYIIDKQGIIRYIFDYQLRAKKHVAEALKTLAGA